MSGADNIRTVLIADDSRTARILLESRLRAVLGKVFIIQAGSGLDAFESARASPPDLLVTALDLSWMNGITLVKKILSTRRTEEPLRVILLTHFNRQLIREQLGGTVRLGFASKPVTENNLARVMEELG